MYECVLIYISIYLYIYLSFIFILAYILIRKVDGQDPWIPRFYYLACTILTRSVVIDPFAAPTTPLWGVSRGPGLLGTLAVTAPCSL
jgi:hypothetical protein